MFDIKQVGRNILEGRKKKNMTQMTLADLMGVSYQAVSNWERGNSMPDISKLDELSRALDMSVETILGSEGVADVVSRAINQQEGNASKPLELDEMAEILPIIKPVQVDNYLEDLLSKVEQIELKDLVKIAPFLTREQLLLSIEKVKLVKDMNDIVALAPFIEKEEVIPTLVSLIGHQFTLNELSRLAPFVRREDLGEIVLGILDQTDDLECRGLYPFLSKEVMKTIADKKVALEGINGIKDMMPFL